MDEGYLKEGEAKRLGAMTQRLAQLLNGYLRATLALKQGDPPGA